MGMCKALALTLLLEEGGAAALRPFFPMGKDWPWAALCVLLCNAITNPSLNAAVILFQIPRGSMIFFLEGIVIAAEGWLYGLLLDEPWEKSLLFSILLNVFSFTIGELCI